MCVFLLLCVVCCVFLCVCVCLCLLFVVVVQPFVVVVGDTDLLLTVIKKNTV